MNPDRRTLLMASLGTLAGGVGAAGAAGDTPHARFTAFIYRGQDAVFDTPLPAGHFRNPILTGFQPDPTLCRVGDDYYLVTSSFSYLPGLPVHHSRDLVNWRLIGHAVTAPGALRYAGLHVSRGLFAPALSFNDGRFYILCTMVGGGGNFVITETDPAGPWGEPTFLPFEGIDPSLFFDEVNGSAWIVNSGAPEGTPRYDGHRAIWLQRFDPKTLTMTGPRRVLVDGGADPSTKPVWIEGPHLFRRDGWLYLCAAEGGTSIDHRQVIFRSRSPQERFEPWSGNPILTQRDLDGSVDGAITCTGHAQMVIGPDGRWWASFLACRPQSGSGGRFWLTGRETFLLPVTWTADGWPVVLPRGQRVPMSLPAPNSARMLASELKGNFEWRDDFRGSALNPQWLALRGDGGARLIDGALELPARRDRLEGLGQPAFLCRRVQHGRFDAELTLPAPAPGVAAGLCLFQSEKQHLLLSLRAGSVRLEACEAGMVRGVAEAKVAAGADTFTLRLRCDGLRVKAEWAQGGAAAQVLGEPLPAELVSVQAAGGGIHFTGAVIGPCAFAA